MDPDPALEQFRDLGDLSRAARRLLARALARGLPVGDQDGLDTTLRHLGQVREGFAITLRTSSCRSRSELRDLVKAILIDWGWLDSLGIRWNDSEHRPVEKPVLQVLAFAHASVTMGAMRHLPSEQVTFPHPRRTYADIPTPRSPGEVLERIEEMESVIARSADRPLSRFGREPVRRTYGYFETGAWLVGQHWLRFGGKG